MHDFGLGDQLCWPELLSTLVNVKTRNTEGCLITHFESNGLIEIACWLFEDSHNRVDCISTGYVRIPVST